MKKLSLPPVVLVFTIIAMVLLNQHLPVVEFWATHFCWVGIPLIILGLGIASWHARLFKRVGTNIDTFEDPDILTTEGLFRVSRNPMYLGFLIMLLGVSIVLGSASPLLALVAFALLTQFWYIPIEERAMHRAFGQAYIDYKRRVRRWL